MEPSLNWSWWTEQPVQDYTQSGLVFIFCKCCKYILHHFYCPICRWQNCRTFCGWKMKKQCSKMCTFWSLYTAAMLFTQKIPHHNVPWSCSILTRRQGDIGKNGICQQLLVGVLELWKTEKWKRWMGGRNLRWPSAPFIFPVLDKYFTRNVGAFPYFRKCPWMLKPLKNIKQRVRFVNMFHGIIHLIFGAFQALEQFQVYFEWAQNLFKT